MHLISLSRIERRRLTVFFSSLILAIIAWLFFALSGRYIYKVDCEINFINAPLNKAYHPLHEDTVTLQLEGTGWQLLFSRIHLISPAVNASLKSLADRDYITFTEQLRDLNRQFKANEKVISVIPDTLFFNFSKRVTKNVPVKLVYSLSFRKSFDISGPVKLVPDSVVVTGAEEDVARINSWNTNVLFMADVNSTIKTKLPFEAPLNNNIDIFPQQVKVEVPVDEFTEKVFDVPLTIMNNHGREVKLLPEKVKITFLTALSNYARFERDSVKAVVNVDGWIKNRYTQLPVVLTKYNPYSKLVKIDPQTVDFFIND